MEPNLSLRDRKKARTHEILVRVAMRLFLERGFSGTTVDDIAEAAMVSQRTFFRYFPTKEAVVFRNHEVRIARFRALLAEHRERRVPIEAVRLALDDMAAVYDGDSHALLDEWRIVTESPLLIARDVELDLEFERAVAEALADQDDADSAGARRARIFAGAIFGTVRAVMQEWFASGCQGDLRELGTEALRMLERGGHGLFGKPARRRKRSRTA